MSAGRPAGPSIDSYTALVLKFVDSIISKSRFQHPTICFCILCSWQNWLIWYHCFIFDILYFGYYGIQQFHYACKAPCIPLIAQYAVTKTFDASLTLIFRKRQGACRFGFGQWRPPISIQWLSAINRKINYRSCIPLNRWPCVDTGSQYAARSTSLWFLRVTVANLC